MSLFFTAFFFLHPIYYPCLTLPLPPLRSGVSHGGRFSPLPTTVRAFIFIARRVQHFLPSSTRVELCYTARSRQLSMYVRTGHMCPFTCASRRLFFCCWHTLFARALLRPHM
ncbi:unnamed protein product, partial [Laminaria digitata]